MFGKTNSQEAQSAQFERADGRPLAMFAMIAAAAFATFALLPSSPSAFASTQPAPKALVDVVKGSDDDAVRTTPKTDRLPAASETARACEGQTWGDESLECLLVIARQGGKEGSIRMVAEAGPVRTTPNVF